MMRLFRTCLILTATLALANCSAVSIVYNNAPSFVAGEIDDAFDLDENQQAELGLAVQRFFDWHRERELARYQVMLNDAALAVGDGVSAQEYLVIYDEVRGAAWRSMRRIIEELQPLAPTLTTAQIDSFDRYFQGKSEKYRDYMKMSAQQRRIFTEDWIIDKLEEWYGNLDTLQYEKISARLQQLPEIRVAWIGYRQARHDAFITALRGARANGLSTQQLEHILLDPDSAHAAAYEPQRLAYRQAFAEMLEEVSGWLSKAQTRHAVERLREYEKIVIELQQGD